MAAVREAEQHTPFCKRDCKLSHHELIKALFLFNNFSDGYSNPGHLHLFYESIQSCISRGWPKDSNVPDPSKDLQCPLVYLACAFGKPKALGLLLKMGFEANVCIRQTGETGLHAAVRYVYQSGAWSVNNRKKGVPKVRPKTRTSSFEKILDSLTEKFPDILGQRDINWDTPLHVAAHELADIREEEHDCSGKKLLMALNNRKLHFEQCFKSMLTKVLQLQQQGIVSAERAIQMICTNNRERKSILNVLSKGVTQKDESLEFLKSVLSELEKRMSSRSVSLSGAGMPMRDVQGTLPSMVVVSPYSNTQTFVQAPLTHLQPQDKQPYKQPYSKGISQQIHSDRKHLTNPTQPHYIVSQNTAEGKAGESSIIHVVFGAEDKGVTQEMRRSFGNPCYVISNNQQPEAVMAMIPTRKQSQQKPNRNKRRNSEPSAQHDNVSNTSMQSQPNPHKTPKTCEGPKSPEKSTINDSAKNNDSSNTSAINPSEINAAISKKSNSAADSLRRELRESYAVSFSLEKQCFKLESERLECLHGIKLRKEQIENLQKEIVELEQKATYIANSKLIVETNWKDMQEREKEMKEMLFPPKPNTLHNVTESSKGLKSD